MSETLDVRQIALAGLLACDESHRPSLVKYVAHVGANQAWDSLLNHKAPRRTANRHGGFWTAVAFHGHQRGPLRQRSRAGTEVACRHAFVVMESWAIRHQPLVFRSSTNRLSVTLAHHAELPQLLDAE